MLTSPPCDSFEQQDWPRLRNYFPSYERFWQLHVVPLRRTGGIHIRSGLDPDLEHLAMNHYTTFKELAGALKVLETLQNLEKSSPSVENYYANLQRAGEVALKTISRFRSIYEKCTGHQTQINDQRIDGVCKRVGPYRNYLHDHELPMVHEDGEFLISVPSMVKRYATWSELGDAPRNHRVPIEQQLWKDFMALSSAIEECWKQMLSSENTGALLSCQTYQGLQKAGRDPSGGIIQRTVLSSNVQER